MASVQRINPSSAAPPKYPAVAPNSTPTVGDRITDSWRIGVARRFDGRTRGGGPDWGRESVRELDSEPMDLATRSASGDRPQRSGGGPGDAERARVNVPSTRGATIKRDSLAAPRVLRTAGIHADGSGV